MSWKADKVIFLVLLVLLYSCHNDGFIKTGSGLKYKIVRHGEGPEFSNGEFVELNMEYYNKNDSLLYSSITRGLPVTMLYNDSIWQNSGQVYEGLSRLRTGDSAIFKVNCRDLYLKSFRMPVPETLDPSGIITFRVGVTRVMNREEYSDYQHQLSIRRETERESRQKRQLIEDTAIIDEYLEKQNIIPMETESGLRYLVEKKGKGPKPQKGETVTLNYTATLLDGTQFESSEEKNKPLKFPVGLGIVIKGLEEGVTLMSKGARYKFYIPSPLAYGDQSHGSLIRPNSILVYDAELTDIKKY